MLKFVFCHFVFFLTQSACCCICGWSSGYNIVFNSVTNFICILKRSGKSWKFLINSCSPLATGIVEQIPVDVLSEVIPVSTWYFCFRYKITTSLFKSSCRYVVFIVAGVIVSLVLCKSVGDL